MNFKSIYESNKQRVVTGALMSVFVIFFALIDNAFFTWAVLGVAYLFAFHETLRLFELEDTKLYVYAFVLWLIALVYPHPSDLIFLILIALLSVKAYKKEADYKQLVPFLYPSISMLFIYALYHDFGMKVFIWFVVVVALTDTAAYCVGKSIGKTPFSPTSPGKTWEGVVGGIAVATVIGTFLGLFSSSFILALCVSLATSIASVFGDLFESLLKREVGVKDSGNLFPGHGGMLDRLDGYLFGAVVMVIVLRGFM